MTPLRPNKAIIYCRVASARSSELTEALHTQELSGRNYALAHGYDVVEVYADHASGLTADRPGMKAMMSRLVEPDQDGWVVLVADAQRIARDIVVYGNIRDTVHAVGARIESISTAITSLELRP